MRATDVVHSPARRVQRLLWLLRGSSTLLPTAHPAFCLRRLQPLRPTASQSSVRCLTTAAAALTPTRLSCAAASSSSTQSPSTSNATNTSTRDSSSAAGAAIKENADADALPVSTELLDALRAMIFRHSPGAWMAVSELYNDLPLRLRRQHVRPHKSMLHVLQKSQTVLGITLNASGTHYAVGLLPAGDVAAEAAERQKKERNQRQQLQMEQQLREQVAARTKQKAPSQHPTQAVSPSTAGATATRSTVAATTKTSDVAATAMSAEDTLQTVMQGLTGACAAPVGNYYDVRLDDVPPPPPDSTRASLNAQTQAVRSSADGAVIAVSDFVSYIPPFFAPLTVVLADMPGYTEEHLRRYFQQATLEIVTVGGVSYVRLHGGAAKLSLAECGAAEERFAAYRPDPSLLPHFVKAFDGITQKWMPLPELLRRVDPAVVAQLPFQGVAAILYFAQMQHKFAFAVRQTSAPPPAQPPSHLQPEAVQPVTEAAVLLRTEGFGGLEAETTPTPKSLNLVLLLMPSEGNIEIATFAKQLTQEVREEIDTYYGGMNQFFAAHARLFYVPPETPNLVMRFSYRQRTYLATASLEEQLRYAAERNNKSKMRVLRRRIAFRDNPEHPFLDPENLAKELSKHLPRRGFTSLKTFLKRGIPEELVVFLPPKVRNFFQNHPQYFVQFEHMQAGRWCLCRPDQPLPSGVIRQSFTEADLVRLIAQFLQLKGPRAMSVIFLNMPRGAQETIKRGYSSMYLFVTRFPQYFNVVVASDTENAASGAVVHLVQVPSVELESPNRGDGDERVDRRASASAAASVSATNSSRSSSSSVSSGEIDSSQEDEDDDDYDGLD